MRVGTSKGPLLRIMVRRPLPIGKKAAYERFKHPL
jgi:hypothetical protein